MIYDLFAIGTGPAGLSTGLYAGRYRMKALVVGTEFGGASSKAGIIWNYPGRPGVDGYELMVDMKKQAKEVGTEVLDDEVISISNGGGCFTIKTKSGKEYVSKSVLFGTGTEHRKLGIPGEERLHSRGVHYCITCDGPVYSDKIIAVVGGGDASVKGINLASEYAKKIYFIVREKEIIAEPINLELMQGLGDKVEILMETEVLEIVGEKRLEKIILSKQFQGTNELILDGLFVEIGARPNTVLAESIGVALDPRGYIAVNNEMATNIPGVFAAGDTVNFFGNFKQDITAAAMGSVAATSAYQYAKTHGNLCMIHSKTVGG